MSSEQGDQLCASAISVGCFRVMIVIAEVNYTKGGRGSFNSLGVLMFGQVTVDRAQGVIERGRSVHSPNGAANDDRVGSGDHWYEDEDRDYRSGPYRRHNR